MSVLEKDVNKASTDSIKSVTISAKQELARRAELQAIRRDMLALAEDKRKADERFQTKLLTLSQRVYELIND